MRLRARHLLCFLPVAIGCARDEPPRTLDPSSGAHAAPARVQAPAGLAGAGRHLGVVYVDPRLLALPAADQRERAGEIARKIFREDPAAASAQVVTVEFTNQEDPRPPKRAVRFFFRRAQFARDSPLTPPVPEVSTTETRSSSSHRVQRQ